MSILNEDSITFGKFKGLTLKEMLRDRSYCKWLLDQDWFQKQYEYLYNRVKEHLSQNPFLTNKTFSLNPNMDVKEFLNSYPYFHLPKTSELSITLSENEKKCYDAYLSIISSLKDQIGNDFINPYDIKTPKSWLQKFETNTKLSRDILKEFLNAYNLPNITTIIEDIKKMGNIEYKGAKSFKIAKIKSLEQEAFWEAILKKIYGEEITVQHKFENCMFDFLRPSSRTLYECKLGLKDFNTDQYRKYDTALKHAYEIIYLISRDCIIDLKRKKIYTIDPSSYHAYFMFVKKPTKLDELIKNFEIVRLESIEQYFNL